MTPPGSFAALAVTVAPVPAVSALGAEVIAIVGATFLISIVLRAVKPSGVSAVIVTFPPAGIAEGAV